MENKRITAESYGNKIIVEVPESSDIEEMCNAFLTLMVGMTFEYNSVIDRMYEYAKERIDLRDGIRNENVE